jgi:uncharacterized protein YidB (DUF937 family)
MVLFVGRSQPTGDAMEAPMGIFDQLGQNLGQALGGSGEGQSPLVQALLQMLSQSGSGGGLAALVKSFQANGLGEIIASWVGTGPNLPISAPQVRQGLGNDLLQQLAGKAGLTPEAASTQLVSLLPGLVDKLTPGGKIPDSGLLEQGLSLLKGKLG